MQNSRQLSTAQALTANMAEVWNDQGRPGAPAHPDYRPDLVCTVRRRDEGAASRMRRHIAKPFSPRQLLAKIHEFLGWVKS
jgi:hypothetical protein